VGAIPRRDADRESRGRGRVRIPAASRPSRPGARSSSSDRGADRLAAARDRPSAGRAPRGAEAARPPPARPGSSGRPPRWGARGSCGSSGSSLATRSRPHEPAGGRRAGWWRHTTMPMRPCRYATEPTRGCRRARAVAEGRGGACTWDEHEEKGPRQLLPTRAFPSSLEPGRIDYIMPPMPPMPPMSGMPPPPPPPLGSGFSAIMASVVSSSPETDAACCRAVRTTLAGSMTPALIRSS